MHAFTPDVSAAPSSGVTSAARSLLRSFLQGARGKPVPAAHIAAGAPSRTVPNLASSTGYMAWLS